MIRAQGLVPRSESSHDAAQAQRSADDVISATVHSGHTELVKSCPAYAIYWGSTLGARLSIPGQRGARRRTRQRSARARLTRTRDRVRTERSHTVSYTRAANATLAFVCISISALRFSCAALREAQNWRTSKVRQRVHTVMRCCTDV